MANKYIKTLLTHFDSKESNQNNKIPFFLPLSCKLLSKCDTHFTWGIHGEAFAHVYIESNSGKQLKNVHRDILYIFLRL